MEFLSEIALYSSTGFIFCMLVFLVVAIFAKYINEQNEWNQKFNPIKFSEELDLIFGKGVRMLILFVLFCIVSFVYVVYENSGISNEEIHHVVNETRNTVDSLIGISVPIILIIIGTTSYDFCLSNSKEQLYQRLKIKMAIRNILIAYVLSMISFISLNNIINLKSQEVSSIMLVLLSANRVTEYTVIIGVIYIFFLLSGFFLDKKKTEEKILNRLHEQFWGRCNIKFSSLYDVRNQEMFLYLTKNYIGTTKRNKNKIAKIQFIEDIDEREEYNLRAVTILSRILLVISIINFLLKNLAIAISCMALLFFVKMFKKQIIKLKPATFLYGSSGYIVMGERSYLIPIVGHCPRAVKNSKNQIIATKNLMGLFYILSKSISVENDIDLFKREIMRLEQNLSCYSENKVGWDKAIYYVPVIVCAYYFYIFTNEEKSLFPVKIVKLFKEFDLSETELKRYKEIVTSLIVDMVRYNPMPRDEEACRNNKDAENYYAEYLDQSGYWEILMQEENEETWSCLL